MTPSSGSKSLSNTNTLESLNYVDQRILKQLSHLDLSGRVNLDAKEFVGGGSYAEVWKAEITSPRERQKKIVAIKQLRFHIKEDIQLLFEREIYVWSKLRHPNILPLLGFTLDKSTGYPFLVSEWMKNGSAWDFIHTHSNFDSLFLATGIARGLVYLHSMGIVHSDIKSDNVVINDAGGPLIRDFGCTRMLTASRTFMNVTTTLKGTARYMAYELFAENAKHSKESDVWAFGMTVFELLTRQRPYADVMQEVQVIMAIVNGRLPTLPTASDCPTACSSYVQAKLSLICHRCWRRSPSDRIDASSILRILSSEVQPVNLRTRRTIAEPIIHDAAVQEILRAEAQENMVSRQNPLGLFYVPRPDSFTDIANTTYMDETRLPGRVVGPADELFYQYSNHGDIPYMAPQPYGRIPPPPPSNYQQLQQRQPDNNNSAVTGQNQLQYLSLQNPFPVPYPYGSYPSCLPPPKALSNVEPPPPDWTVSDHGMPSGHSSGKERQSPTLSQRTIGNVAYQNHANGIVSDKRGALVSRGDGIYGPAAAGGRTSMSGTAIHCRPGGEETFGPRLSTIRRTSGTSSSSSGYWTPGEEWPSVGSL